MTKLTLLALCTLFVACAPAGHKQAPADSSSTQAPASLAPLPSVLLLPGYPLSLEARATTDGNSALAHLQGSIALAEQQLAAMRKACQCTPEREQIKLAGVLFQRYQWLGALADLDRVVELIHGVEASVHDEQSLWLLASVASHLHEFDRAVRVLERTPPSVTRNRLLEEIEAARSLKPERTSGDSQALSAGHEMDELMALAHNCLAKGNLECASKHFHAAQFVYHDVAPLPLAWLHTQQGIALLRFGFHREAIPFFRAAVARAPGYLIATEHLAECLYLSGEHQAALELYQQVVAQTGNPEFIAARADVELALAQTDTAEQSRERAKAGYANLLKRYPNAYAMHAVGFYLEQGDIARATDLAEQNIKLRQDASSWLLLAETSLASGNTDAACQSLAKVRSAGLNPPEAMALANSLGNCAK
jgi:tetratricopeptide (TPR) repeat protein